MPCLCADGNDSAEEQGDWRCRGEGRTSGAMSLIRQLAELRFGQRREWRQLNLVAVGKAEYVGRFLLLFLFSWWHRKQSHQLRGEMGEEFYRDRKGWWKCHLGGYGVNKCKKRMNLERDQSAWLFFCHTELCRLRCSRGRGSSLTSHMSKTKTRERQRSSLLRRPKGVSIMTEPEISAG